MKNIHKIFIIGLLVTSCSDEVTIKIKSSFDSPFPKRTKDLTWNLGKDFSLKRESDTLDFKVTFNKDNRYNYIIEKKAHDTVFAGTVCKYKGLYYFNRQINDTSYWIYAVKIQNGTIIGLQTDWIQMLSWDSKFDRFLINPKDVKNAKSSVLKYVDLNKDIIKLTPEKRVMKKFYEAIIDSLPIDTLINWYKPIQDIEIEKKLTDIELLETNIDQLDIIDRLYPNPAKDNVTLVLNYQEIFQYGIFDINGKLIDNGKLKALKNNINTSYLKNGIYFLRVYPSDNDEVETVKIIIEK